MLYFLSGEDDECRSILKTLYKYRQGFGIPEDERELVEQRSGERSHMYGEVSFDGVAIVLQHLQLTATDTFYDLGCGVGKVCWQALLQTPVTSVVGIELAKSRFDVAQHTLELQAVPEGKSLRFLHEDFLHSDVTQSRVIFLGATCFSAQLMDALANFIPSLANVHTVVSTKQFVSGLPNFTEETSFQVPTTFHRMVPAHIFRREA